MTAPAEGMVLVPRAELDALRAGLAESCQAWDLPGLAPSAVLLDSHERFGRPAVHVAECRAPAQLCASGRSSRRRPSGRFPG